VGPSARQTPASKKVDAMIMRTAGMFINSYYGRLGIADCA
jgi:hypothetical protein